MKYSSETSLDFQKTTWLYIPQDITLHNHCFENSKFYKITFDYKNTWIIVGKRIIFFDVENLYLIWFLNKVVHVLAYINRKELTVKLVKSKIDEKMQN
jgi:hypothetical protein